MSHLGPVVTRENLFGKASRMLVLVLAATLIASEPLLTFQAADADQGVAVDEAFVYVIDNTAVAKHDKFTGEMVKRWEGGLRNPRTPVIHMNSGVVVDRKLYCAHSNYPGLPMTSSVEIFDTEKLGHIDAHNFGITDGSLTWMDWYDDFWWACFAHYDGRGGDPDKDHTWTRLVQYDADMKPLQSWTFPKVVLGRFKPNSCSGGTWGPDGVLYVTGHDRSEIYGLRVPESGSVLEYVGTNSFPIEGQAIAFDRTGAGLLYGLVRSTNTVVAQPFPPR